MFEHLFIVWLVLPLSVCEHLCVCVFVERPYQMSACTVCANDCNGVIAWLMCTMLVCVFMYVGLTISL